MDKIFIAVLIFVGRSYFIDSFGLGQDGLLLLGSESGIGFIERPVDGWSANNSSTFVVQSLNLTSEGWAKHLAGQFANDVLLWFHPGDTGLILYTTGRVRAKNFSSPILHFDDRCSGQVNGISVDWLNENVYWIDAAYNWVKMAALANPQNYVKVVVDEGISNPTAMTLYPSKSYIFWADSDFGVIKRSDLSGSQQMTFTVTPGQWVIAMEADFAIESVIWLNIADSVTPTIERITVNGLRRTTILASPGLKTFADLTLYNNVTFLVKYNESGLGILGTSGLSDAFLSPRMSYSSIYTFGSELQQPALTSPCLMARCQHFCVTVDSNTRGVCFCGLGYHLNIDGVNCEVDAYLTPPKYLVFLGPAQGYISFYEVWAPDWSERSHQVLLQGLNSLTAMAVAFQGHFMYVAYSKGYIEMISLTSAASLRSKKYWGIGRVEGIAIDWISSNVYWTDSKRGYIMVAFSDLSSAFLLHSMVNAPSGIAVDAPNRRIFWGENGRSPAIMMSSTDGTGRSRFVFSNLVSPEKLVVDNMKQRLYWTDSGKGTVEFVSLVGDQNRQTLVKRLPSALLYGISLYQDYVAWTERGTSRGIFWKLNSDRNSSTVKAFYSLTNPPGEILLFGKFAQPEQIGPCSVGNGGCSQLCLPKMNSSSDRTCVCSLGYDLAKDNFTCLQHVLDHPEDNFLLLSDVLHPAIYQLDIDTEVPRILPLPLDQKPTAVIMDLQNQTLYWSDGANSVIHRRSMDQNTSEIFLQLPKGSGVNSIAFDDTNDLLYFTLSTTGVIYASPTNATNQTIDLIIGLQQPRDVTVDVTGRVIYWTEVGRIGRAKLDNLTDRVYVVSNDEMTRLQGLAVHPQWNRVFWCNGSSVYMSDLNGRNVTMVVDLNPSVVCVGVAAYDDALYAIDSSNQDIICINWIQGTYYILEKMPYQQLTAIHVVPILRKTKAYEDQRYSDSGKNGIIVGSVLGAAVLILGIVTLVLWRCWRKNERPRLTRLHEPQKPHHPCDDNSYLSPVHISDDISHVSYYAKGVFRTSPGELHPKSNGQNLSVYDSWSNDHQRQGRERHNSGTMGKDQTSMYDTASVISDASSTSPFVKVEKPKKKRGRTKRKTGDSGNRSRSESRHYSTDEHYANSSGFPSFSGKRRNSSHDMTISAASAFHAKSFFGGRSWGDTLPKQF